MSAGEHELTPERLAALNAARLLMAAKDALDGALSLDDLATPLRTALRHLLVEIAGVHGVCEWVAEGLAELQEPNTDLPEDV